MKQKPHRSRHTLVLLLPLGSPALDFALTSARRLEPAMCEFGSKVAKPTFVMKLPKRSDDVSRIPEVHLLCRMF